MAIEYEINKRGGGTKKFYASTASTGDMGSMRVSSSSNGKAAATDVNATASKAGRLTLVPSVLDN